VFHLSIKSSIIFVSVLKVVFELQALFDVVVMKEFIDNFCSVNTPSLSSTEVYMEGN